MWIDQEDLKNLKGWQVKLPISYKVVLTIFGENAGIRNINTGSDEAHDVIVLQIFHLLHFLHQMASDFDFLLVVDRFDGHHLPLIEAYLHKNLFVRSTCDCFAVY